MYKKLFRNAIVLSVLAALGGCNSGSSNTATISASVTSGPCTGMSTAGQTCTITVTYNANGASNAVLGTSWSPSQPSNLNFSWGNCPTSAITGSGSCYTTVTMQSVSTTNVNVSFTLAGTTSNSTQITN